MLENQSNAWVVSSVLIRDPFTSGKGKGFSPWKIQFEAPFLSRDRIVTPGPVVRYVCIVSSQAKRQGPNGQSDFLRSWTSAHLTLQATDIPLKCKRKTF